jgi:Arc/MetJ-type ribon-helix-helix transcriptional regulator
MTIQITVRLPDELVHFVDGQVAAGSVTSRAEAVKAALVHERRRQAALMDVEILRRSMPDPDLEAIVEHTSANPIDLDR